MPFLTGWVVILISCVFMGTVAIEVERGCVATLLVEPKGGSMIGNLAHRSEQTENEPVQSTDLRTRRFNGAVILFQNIIEVLHRSMSTILLQSLPGFESHDGR
jgi:hypothetical protein